MNDERPGGWRRRRKILVYGAAAVLAVVLALLLVWLFVWRSEAPPPPSVLERSEALTATPAQPSPVPLPVDPPPAPAADPPTPAEPPPPVEPPPPATADPPPATEPPSPAEPAPVPPDPPAEAPPEPPPPPPPTAATEEPATPGGVNLDGVWSVDVTLGSYEDYTSSWAGYRVGEELSGIGATDAVGRTPGVTGTLEISGTTVVAAAVAVDLTTVVSDRPQRDGLVRRALEVQQFPAARFELTEPVTFEALPAAGESVTAGVAGTFEIRGVSRPVTVTLEATWIEGVVIVGGTFEIRFEDYGISPPRAPVVLSVEDTGTVELLLNFTR